MVTGSLENKKNDLDDVDLNVGGTGTDVGKYEYPETFYHQVLGESSGSIDFDNSSVTFSNYSGSIDTTFTSSSFGNPILSYEYEAGLHFNNDGLVITGNVYVDGKEYDTPGKIAWHNTDNRPWGTYEVLLDDPDCKVKKITVNPGEHPSYQYHKKRSELWQIISGYGIVTLDGEEREVVEGNVIRVMKGEKHKIEAFGNTPLVFIEIQRGEYFGEDDIIRLEDKYGRVKKTKKSKKKK